VKRLLPLIALCAASARATTFLVPTDRELVAAAKAIVVATAGQSTGRPSPGGALETVTELRVEESIKGPVAAGATIHVTEAGGSVERRHYIVPGSPRYAPGERVLLFLDTNGRGEWVSKAMAIGKFSARGAHFVREELCGWSYDGAPHVEPLRSQAKFLDFVRDVARGRMAKENYVVPRTTAASEIGAAANGPTTYVLQWHGPDGAFGIRWNRFPSGVVFLSHGTQPGALNGGLTSLQRGVSAWTNDGDSNIVYTYGGTTNAPSGFVDPDGINSVQFNDPMDEIPGQFTGNGGDVLARGGGWFEDASLADTHMFAGERFFTIFEADVVVQNGITGGGLTGNGFDRVLTHELGHTLGLRHADSVLAGGGTYSAVAVMTGSVTFNGDLYGANLQGWDREAISVVYGSGATPACKAPQITAQPQSVTLGTSPVMLTVSAIGDAPLQYQWYTGARSNTAAPVAGAIGASITVQPAATTVYWCRVSNGCNPPVDSAAATVTVNGCPAVTVESVSTSVAIVQGTTITLAASANGATSFQWFAGNAPLSGATTATVDVTPAVTTTYWLRASNACGASADSERVTITVQPCSPPVITEQPASATVTGGSSATIYAGIAGSQPMSIVWYMGDHLDTSRPLYNGNSQTLVTPPLNATTSFWASARNLCGAVDTAAATITLSATCVTPAITTQPRDTVVAPGKSAHLSVAVTGTSLTYQWYEGAVLDFTHPLGGSSPSLTTPPITAPTKFWVRISSPCGSVDSLAAAVSVGEGRRRAVGR
jgi:hypothetical protein